jgi:hypothetical protein
MLSIQNSLITTGTGNHDVRLYQVINPDLLEAERRQRLGMSLNWKLNMRSIKYDINLFFYFVF